MPRGEPTCWGMLCLPASLQAHSEVLHKSVYLWLILFVKEYSNHCSDLPVDLCLCLTRRKPEIVIATPAIETARLAQEQQHDTLGPGKVPSVLATTYVSNNTAVQGCLPGQNQHSPVVRPARRPAGGIPELGIIIV